MYLLLWCRGHQGEALLWTRDFDGVAKDRQDSSAHTLVNKVFHTMRRVQKGAK